MSKLILATMFFFAFSPLFADLPSYSINGYTIYDCGAPGSAGYQSCLNAMTLGEAEFMATYTPTGSPLPSNWQDLLPSLGHSGAYWNIVALSSDHLSDAIADNGAGDNSVEYIWHDGAFASVFPEQLSEGTQPEVYINDQGAIAGSGDCYLFESPGPALPCRSTADFFVNRPGLTLNDDNQLLAIGLGLECLETSGLSGCADNNTDSVLVDPPGAPIPGVPEPASLALLATVVALVIPLIRKIQADRRAQNSRPILRASDV
jgi:hypothetical protein